MWSSWLSTKVGYGPPLPRFYIESSNNGQIREDLHYAAAHFPRAFANSSSSSSSSSRPLPMTLPQMRRPLCEEEEAADAALAQGSVNRAVEAIIHLPSVGISPSSFLRKGRRASLLSSGIHSLLLSPSQLEHCVDLFQKLAESGLNVKNLVQPAFLIEYCMRMQKVNTAVRYASLLPKRSNHYNIIIREAGKLRNLEAAFMAFDMMKQAGVTPTMFTYRSLIDACSRCNKPESAGIIFKGLQKSNTIPNKFVYNSYMNACIANLEEVLETYKHMKKSGVASDISSYNILLKAFTKSRRADLVASLYQDLLKHATTGEIRPDNVTFSTVIQSFGKVGSWEKALQVRNDMQLIGLKPDVQTWASLIKVCAKCHLVDKAFEIYGEMLEQGCSPNLYCFNHLLDACVEAGQHERVFNIFEELKSRGRISAFLEGNDIPDMANDGCGHCESLKVNHSIKPSVVTYNILLKARGSSPEGVRSLMKEMKDVGLTPDEISWSTLIDVYGSHDNLEGAIQAFYEMLESGVSADVISYTTLIKVCVGLKDFKKAFEIFEAMKNGGVLPNVITYNTLLRALRGSGKLEDVQRALALYEEMRTVGYSPNENILKGLLHDWAEGMLEGVGDKVVQSNATGESQKIIPGYTDLLLQKVSTHTHLGSLGFNLVIDLHGLTKMEARIAVLALLRILKESNLKEESVQKDLVIITGVGKHSEVRGVCVLQDAMLNVLEKELKLPVLQYTRSSLKQEDRFDKDDKFVLDTVSDSILLRNMPRKPVKFGTLIVPKEALKAWLRKSTISI